MDRLTTFKLAIVFSSGLALSGCAAKMLEKRAAFDLQCPKGELQFHDTGPGSKGVTGCGQQVTYVWTESGWILNTDSRPTKDSAQAKSESSSSAGTSEDSEPTTDALYSNLAPKVQFPEDAAGFEFRSNPEAVQAACESAGHEWTDTAKGATCSGLPKEIGAPGESQVRFCGGRLCRLGVAIPVDRGNLTVPIGIWSSLNEKYGKPTKSKTKVPASCKESLYECIVSGEAAMNNLWRWNDDSKITARFEKTGDDLYLVLYYALPMTEDTEEGKSVSPEDFSDTF